MKPGRREARVNHEAEVKFPTGEQTRTCRSSATRQHGRRIQALQAAEGKSLSQAGHEAVSGLAEGVQDSHVPNWVMAPASPSREVSTVPHPGLQRVSMATVPRLAGER